MLPLKSSFPILVAGSPLRFVSQPEEPTNASYTVQSRPYRKLPLLEIKSSENRSTSPHGTTNDLPRSPMAWSWICHKCNTRFPLGTTQRCLFDDHQICFGRPTKAVSRKKYAACGTEFDYSGWANWVEWKRCGLASKLTPTPFHSNEGIAANHQNCWAQCRFPSDCRWKARQSDIPASNKVTEGIGGTQNMGIPLSLSALTISARKKMSQKPRLTRTNSAPALSPIPEEPIAKSEPLSSRFSLPVLSLDSFETMFRQFPAYNGHRHVVEGTSSAKDTTYDGLIALNRAGDSTGKEPLHLEMEAIDDCPASPLTSDSDSLASSTPLSTPGAFDGFDFGFEPQIASAENHMPKFMRRNAKDWTAGMGVPVPSVE